MKYSCFVFDGEIVECDVSSAGNRERHSFWFVLVFTLCSIRRHSTKRRELMSFCFCCSTTSNSLSCGDNFLCLIFHFPPTTTFPLGLLTFFVGHQHVTHPPIAFSRQSNSSTIVHKCRWMLTFYVVVSMITCKCCLITFTVRDGGNFTESRRHVRGLIAMANRG